VGGLGFGFCAARMDDCLSIRLSRSGFSEAKVTVGLGEDHPPRNFLINRYCSFTSAVNVEATHRYPIGPARRLSVVGEVITLVVEDNEVEGAMTGGQVVAVMSRPGRSTTDELLVETVRLANAVRGLVPEADSVDRRDALRRLWQVAKVGELTAILGYCVAWLLVRKAVEVGELSVAEGRADERRLGMVPARAPAGFSLEAVVGAELAALDARVKALHARLARLDRLLDEAG
jgi:hypothetical protein